MISTLFLRNLKEILSLNFSQIPKTLRKIDCIPEDRRLKTWAWKARLVVGPLSLKSTRFQLAKHRKGHLPCWTDITDRLREGRAESPKEYRDTDPVHILDRVSHEAIPTTVESKRRTTRQSLTEDYVPIPEKHHASPVRKSVSEKEVPSGSIRERHLIIAQLHRPVSVIVLI